MDQNVLFFKFFGVDPKIEERGHVLARGLVAFAETSSAAREHALILIAKAETSLLPF